MTSVLFPLHTLMRFPRVTCSWVFVLAACLMLSATTASQLFAATAPKIVSVSPVDGATQVPVTAALVIVFDQDMDVTVPPVQSTSGFVGSFDFKAPGFTQPLSGTWGADKRTMTIKPALPLPYATFTWTLNPPTQFPFIRIKSAAGVDVATVSGTFTTGIATTTPHLGSSVPFNGATDVSVDVLVEFRFDQPMKKETALGGNPPTTPGAVAWTGNGIDPKKFNYSWSTDGRSLFCAYATNFPTNTVISWALNPTGAAVKLQGTNGQAVASDTYSGEFTTTARREDCLGQLPDSWGQYGIYKNSNYQQTSSADPIPDPTIDPYTFSALVVSSQFGQGVKTGSLTLPNGTVKTLPSLGSVAQFYETSETEPPLNAAYPAGTYTLRFQQNVGNEVSINMTLPSTAPPIPKILNLPELQSIAPGADFTLRWNPFTGATGDAFISVYITDENGTAVFQAPDYCLPRPLPVTATSVVVPAGTLRTNKTYACGILFSQPFYRSTNAVPFMAGSGDVIRKTVFSVRTTGAGTPVPAQLTAYRLLPNGNPQFVIRGTAGASYSIQRATQLSPGNWTELGVVNLPASGEYTFEDTQTGKPFPLFYKVVSK